MRYILLSVIFLLITCICNAQIKKDTGEIQRLKYGQYAFSKGEVHVTFSDTISPGFVEQQMRLLGYEIIDMNVRPIFAWIQNNPGEKALKNLEQDPRVQSISITQMGISEEALQKMFERDSVTSVKKQEEIRARFKAMTDRKDIRVFFNYNVDEQSVLKFIQENDIINFRLNMISPKTAIIKTEIDKEKETMEALERLIYVESTAFVGTVYNQN